MALLAHSTLPALSTNAFWHDVQPKQGADVSNVYMNTLGILISVVVCGLGLVLTHASDVWIYFVAGESCDLFMKWMFHFFTCTIRFILGYLVPHSTQNFVPVNKCKYICVYMEKIILLNMYIDSW